MKTSAKEPPSGSPGHNPLHVEANHDVPDLIAAIDDKTDGYDDNAQPFALTRPQTNPPEGQRQDTSAVLH